MAISTPIAAGWLNQNSLRSYPFHEGSGLRPNDSTGAVVEGGWTVPNCLLVDLSLSVVGSEYDPFLYMSKMSVVAGTVSITFADANGDPVFTVATGVSTHVVNKEYQVAGVGSFLGSRGVVCIGDLEAFLQNTPEGAYSFSPEETRVEPTCIKPSAVGVRSLRYVDADGYESKRFYGDVSLVAGSNIRFDCDVSKNAIIVSADPNSGYAEECDCGTGEGKFVRSINGIQVEHVWIKGDDCVSVTSDTGSGVITVSDKCAKPCCGCAETTFINQTINNLQTSVSTLTNNIDTIGDKLESFIDNYLLGRKSSFPEQAQA